MTDTPTLSRSAAFWQWLPQLRSRWWTLLLGLSLMLNFLIGGLAIGHRFVDGPGERLNGVSYVQLIPRRFFQELPSERRGLLMDIVRNNRPEFRKLRAASEETSIKLAEVLEKPIFSIEDVRKTVAQFATGTESLASRGGEVVVDIVQRLTPEERQALAAAIRQRDQKQGKKK